MSKLYDSIVEEVKTIDVEQIEKWGEDGIKVNETEKQMIYIWIRLYLKDDVSDIKEGDEFKMLYTPSGESLTTKFIAFGKKNSFKDSTESNDIKAVSEDDNKILCLMVDENVIQNGKKIPFLRTLFKISRHFEYQVYRRDELTFTNTRTGVNMLYIECEF